MALTEGRHTNRIPGGVSHMNIPVKAGTIIYDGSMVAINEDGYAIPGEADANLIAAGMAWMTADNRLGADGDITVEVERGTFIWDNDSDDTKAVQNTDLLKECYILDDHTVTMASVGSSVAGKIVGIYSEGIAVVME